jgi:hypothetical protein
MLAMGGEGLLKKVEKEQEDREFGRLIGRAMELGEITPQDIQFRFGYSDQAAISRWKAGTEKPPMAKLTRISAFRYGLMEALAECDGEEVIVETVIRRRRKAVSA